ncbi:MAG: hypothetical protein HOE02_05545 [Candidatus Marinimicrobia bacterium]|jgi:hypothetical protein|nr:hypothetical protein [Candidatus Neomarinimicrobiota bacterium]
MNSQVEIEKKVVDLVIETERISNKIDLLVEQSFSIINRANFRGNDRSIKVGFIINSLSVVLLKLQKVLKNG